MQTIGTIREFKTPNFHVIVDAVEDHDADLSWDETGEVMQQIKDGELVCFAARARVLLDDSEIASDYLGGCVYSDIRAFENHRECGAETRNLRAAGSNAVCGSYFADMVKTVCSDAREYMRALRQVKVRA